MLDINAREMGNLSHKGIALGFDPRSGRKAQSPALLSLPSPAIFRRRDF
jgi:hypothetical protein